MARRQPYTGVQLDAATVHRPAQQRVAFLQSAHRKHPRILAGRNEVAAQLFPVLAHVPRERVRPRRGLFAGLVAVDQAQLRVRGHILPERGSGQVPERRDVWLDRLIR